MRVIDFWHCYWAYSSNKPSELFWNFKIKKFNANMKTIEYKKYKQYYYFLIIPSALYLQVSLIPLVLLQCLYAATELIWAFAFLYLAHFKQSISIQNLILHNRIETSFLSWMQFTSKNKGKTRCSFVSNHHRLQKIAILALILLQKV